MNKLLITILICAGCLTFGQPLNAQNPTGTNTLERILALKKSQEIRYLEHQREYQTILWGQETSADDANAEKTTSEIFKEMIREKMKLLEKEMERARELDHIRAYKLSKKRKVLTAPRP